MFEIFNSSVFWLTFTNIALGILTLFCLVLLFRAVIVEVFERRKAANWLSKLADDHAFFSSDLGLTMADGGKKIDEKESERLCVTGNIFDEPEDEKHIFRSEN